MAHGGVNLYACGNASGLARPALPPKIAAWAKDTKKVEVDRDTAIQFLGDSFDFCLFEWLWAYFTHTAHHRAQAEVYLRVKRIKPPDYVFY